MAFPDFHNDTFVAFCDISGFKNKMTRNASGAIQSLGNFYSVVYDALQKTRGNANAPVFGLVVSDCAILVAENRDSFSNQDALKSLLWVIKEINKESLPYDIMLTTSIAFGRFVYQERAEFFGIEKNMVTGAAYIKAYIDQSSGRPKLKCGECRLIADGLPPEIDGLINQNEPNNIFQMLVREDKYFYFYWMREQPIEIEAFKKLFQDTENLKFIGMRLALQGSRDLEVRGRTANI